MNKLITGFLAVTAALGLIFGLTACDEDRAISVPQSFCGFVQGKGGLDSNNNVNNADLKQVLYQGQTSRYKSDQDLGKFFPCVTRNYVSAQDGLSADTHWPVEGRTSDGIPVRAYFTVYWQPNQSPDAIRDFIGFCQGKYGCAADDPSAFNGTAANGQNNSTEGWNKFLGENMFPVIQRIFEQASRTVNDDVWKFSDPELRQKIADEMSDRFAEAFQQTTGTVSDLVCGSGSTGTGDTFNCENVRIVIDNVWASQGNMQNDANAAAEADSKRKLDEAQKQADIDLTNAKYGPLGPAFRACRDLGSQCKFVVGPEGIQVQVS